jgi:hypothetical protein
MCITSMWRRLGLLGANTADLQGMVLVWLWGLEWAGNLGSGGLKKTYTSLLQPGLFGMLCMPRLVIRHIWVVLYCARIEGQAVAIWVAHACCSAILGVVSSQLVSKN